jgi:tryptophan synthase beta chain
MVSKLQGKGLGSGLHAASLTGGTPGILHGNRTYLLQNDDGQITDAHSISAGLDYPESALNIHGFMILAASIMLVPPMKKRLSPFSFVRVLKASFRRSNHHMRWPILAPSLAIWILMILSF